MSQPEFSSPDSQFANDLSRGADDWKPTPHGETLARALTTHDLVSDKEVLELGGGIGNHTIIMARRRPRRLVTTEIAERLIATTRANVERHVPEARSIMEYRVADWLQTQGQFDVVITNPPFARSGQRNRRYFIDSLILDGHRRLKPGGQLIFVQSSMADLGKTRRRLGQNGFRHEIILETEGPFRSYYFDDPTFMDEIQTVPHGFEIRDGTHYERLFVIRATLQPWKPPVGAHIVDR